MESKVILFCVLLFCSKIVDSVAHPEDHVRQRVHPLSNWQVNQNAANAQYPNADFTQSRNVNNQQSHQGRYNYDSNGYNRSPGSPSGEDVLVSYDSPIDLRRLDSSHPRPESYKSRTSQAGFDNPQYRNQNWRSQKQYTDSAPSTVHIPEDERPLVTTVQEPYQGQVQYLQPKYVPSSNRQFYQPGRSYLTGEQLKYPLTGDGKYVANSTPRFGTNGRVPYENNREDQVRASEIKVRPTVDQRYMQSFVPQSEIIYNEAPAVVATDTLTDQSENINYLENYKSPLQLSNTAPIRKYNDFFSVIPQADNYSLDSEASNGPVSYESNIDGQATASEVKTIPTGDRRYLKSFAPQSGGNYNTAPVVIATDTLIDQSENIKYLENYKSRSHLSNTAPIRNYNDVSPVIPQADNYSSDSEASNGAVPYDSYIDGQATASEVKRIRPSGGRKYVKSFAPQPGVNYNTAPVVLATNTLKDQSENIKYLENYKSRSNLSNTAPISNYNDVSPVIPQADNYSSDSEASNGAVPYDSYIDGQATASEVKRIRPSGGRKYLKSVAPQPGVNYNTAPVVIATDTLKDQINNIKYVENFKSDKDLSNTAPATNLDETFPLISEVDNNSDSTSRNVNIKKEAPGAIHKDFSENPLARRYSNNYRSDSGWSDIARDGSSNGAPVLTETVKVTSGKYEENYEKKYGPKEPVPINTYSGIPSAPSDTVMVNSGSNKSYVGHHGSSSPTPFNTNPKQNAYHTTSSGITEFNLKTLVASPEVQKILAGSSKRYLVIHPNGTVETMDKIDLDSHQNSKLRLVHAKRKNIDDSGSDGVFTQQSPEKSPNIPNQYRTKTPVPANEYTLFTNDQPADDKKPTPLHADPANPADEYAKYKHIDGSDHDGVLIKQSPENSPNIIAKTTVPAKEYPFPTNDQPADDKKPTPLHGDQAIQADEYTNPKNSDDSNSDGVLTKQSPENLTSVNAKTPVSANEYTLPTNAKPADDKKPTPLHGDQAIPADKYAKPKNSDDSNSDGVLTKQLSDNLTSISAKTPVPVNEYTLPTNDQPADDKKSTPLLVDQANPADENDSNLSLQLKDLPANHSIFKPLPQPEKQSVDDNKPKSLPSYILLANDNNSTSLTPNEDKSVQNNILKSLPQDVNLPRDDDDSKSLTPHVNQPVDGNSKPLPHNGNQPAVDDNSNQLSPNKTQHDDNLKSLTSKQDQPENNHSKLGQLKDENNLTPRQPAHVKNSKHSYVKHSANDKHSKPLPTNGNQPHDDKPFHLYRRQPAHHDKLKHLHLSRPEDDNNLSTSSSPRLNYPESQPSGDHNSNPSSSGQDTTGEDNTSKPSSSNVNHSEDDNDFKTLRANKRQPERHNKPKHSHVIRPADDNNSSTSSSPQLNYPESQPSGDHNSNPSSSGEDATGDDNTSKPSSSNANHLEDDNDFKPLRPNKRQPAHHHKPKHSHIDQPEDDHYFSPLSPGVDQSGNNNDFKPSDANLKPLRPNKRQSAHHKKSTHSHVEKSEDDENSNPSSPDKNKPENYDNSKPLHSNEHQTEDKTDSTSLPSHKKQPSHHYKSKSGHSYNTANDNNSSPTSAPLLNYPENQPTGDQNSTPSSPAEDSTGDDNTSKPLPPNDDQSGDDNGFKPSPEHATQSVNKTKSKPSHGDQAGDDNNTNPSSPEKNQPSDDSKTKPSSAVASKNNDRSSSTTVSPIVPNYTTSSKPQVIKTHTHKHMHRKSSTNSPVASTTPCPDDISEDQIITLSPIEQITDNVSDVPPVVTISTTTKPVTIPGKSDIINDANNKPDVANDDKAHTYSTTTVSPSTSTSPTDNISGNKTIDSIENNTTQTKNNTGVDQVNKREKDTQTAVYNSSELFDTNSDVPAESDDYSIVTASLSVQNDVNTGGASGDNSLTNEQSETDVTITVSSSKANDSEDETITINIDISESTDGADSSNNNKSLVVSIDTDDGSDDDYKTPKPGDCKKDHSSDDGKGKNVEIDMSNLKGEPTMWIRTTNRDFIDKLTDKNNTEFDVIYFFHMDNQAVIEREKATTIYCNGTIVIETTETKYTHKDDPAPTVVKTVQIVDVIADVI